MRYFILLSFCFCCTTLTMANAVEEEFFLDSKLGHMRLHPEGKVVVLVENQENGQALVLVNPINNRRSVILPSKTLTQNKSYIREVQWVDGQSIAVELSEVKKGIKDLIDTKFFRQLFILRLNSDLTEIDEIKQVRTSGKIINPLVSEVGQFLYAKSGLYSKIYRLNVGKLAGYKEKIGKLTRIDGGQFIPANEVASVEGHAVNWFLDEDGSPESVLRYKDEKTLVLDWIKEKKDKKELSNWTLGDERKNEGTEPLIIPVAVGGSDGVYYGLDFNEVEEKSVYRIDFNSGENTLVYRSESFKILELIFSPKDDAFTGVKVLKDGRVGYEYITQSEAGDKVISVQQDDTLEVLIDYSLDERFQLFYREGHSQPGHFLIVDNKLNKSYQMGSHYPQLMGKLSSRLVDGSVDVNGLKIPYLLSLPTGKSKLYKQGSPLIVMAHGGPIGVYDDRYFDVSSQYFVQQGFAVLRVNFRGSGGYTQELKDAGTKQFGNLMLVDIHSAVLQVSQRSDIDEGRICTLGMSYGGYASAMLVINHPDIYRCGVTIAGVSDINLYLNEATNTRRQEKWLKEKVGDSYKDYDKFKGQSPVFLSKKLERPLFIIHGDMDGVVDVEHAYRLKAMLDKYKKSYEWKIYPDMGHSFNSSKDTIDLFSRASHFIRKNLGIL